MTGPQAALGRESRVDAVTSALRDHIRSLDPRITVRLRSERALAEKLGVSRPVLREAIQRLEVEGLLEVRHGVGVQVTSKLHKPLLSSLTYLMPDLAERLTRLTEVRRLIEPQAARLAAERAGSDRVRGMREANARLAGASKLETAVESDLEFHRILAQATGNPVLVLLYDTIADLGRASRAATLSALGIEGAVRQHAAILDAVERRDPDAAELAMASHMSTTEADIASLAGRRLSDGSATTKET